MTEWKVSFVRMNDVRNGSGADMAKLLSGLGLCVKAGKVIFGVPMICEAMKKSQDNGKNAMNFPLLVLEAGDTSENTHKKISDKCKFYRVEHIRLCCGGEQLAAAVGKSSALGAVAVTDMGMCLLIKKYI